MTGSTPGTTTFAFTILNPLSGLTLTTGETIHLEPGPGGLGLLVLGIVDSGPLAGKVAFAIVIDPATGQGYMAEVLSLFHDPADIDQALQLATGSLGVTVTITTDGGTASATIDVSGQINFLDDEPTLTVTAAEGEALAGLVLEVDETVDQGDHYNTRTKSRMRAVMPIPMTGLALVR